MKKKHLYSMATDVYATGWIAQRIWDEDWDKTYFKTTNTEQYTKFLALKLDSLLKVDVNKRASVSSVLDLLTKTPYCWTMP